MVSLAGIATIPIPEERLREVTFVLISLATGALFGDAILHLLPDIFKDPSHHLSSSLWILAGIGISFVLEKFLRWKHEHGLDHEEGHGHHHGIKPVGRILLLSDGMHNFVDGLLIGASYLVGIKIGIATTLAVILHELPHEIGDFGILIDAGYSRSKAVLFNFISACVALLGVCAAFAFDSGSTRFSTGALAITAGSFLYIAGSNLTPELHKVNDPMKSLFQILSMILGVGLMSFLLLLE